MSVCTARVTPEGKLEEKFLPAIYLDTNLVIDYSLVEGDDVSMRTRSIYENSFEKKVDDAIREVLSSDKHLSKMSRLRSTLLEKLIDGTLQPTLIVSPFVLMEYMKWNAEAAFRSYAERAAGSWSIKRMSDKQIGDSLKCLMKMRMEEVKRERANHSNRIVSDNEPLGSVMSDVWLNGSYIDSALDGLFQVDVANFTFSISDAWGEPSAYAVLQIGASDILHIVLAKHLGCRYIASRDADFTRASEIIKEETGLIVLKSADEILSLL